MRTEQCKDNQEDMDDEHRAVIARAIEAATYKCDTPIDSGFGYAGNDMPLSLDPDDTEIVSMIQPVPYCGDERPYRHVRQRIDPFMRDLPA